MTTPQALVKLEIAIPLVLWQAWETGDGPLAILQDHGLFPLGLDRRIWTYRCRLDAASQAYIVAFDVGFQLPAQAGSLQRGV